MKLDTKIVCMTNDFVSSPQLNLRLDPLVVNVSLLSLRSLDLLGEHSRLTS